MYYNLALLYLAVLYGGMPCLAYVPLSSSVSRTFTILRAFCAILRYVLLANNPSFSATACLKLSCCPSCGRAAVLLLAFSWRAIPMGGGATIATSVMAMSALKLVKNDSLSRFIALVGCLNN